MAGTTVDITLSDVAIAAVVAAAIVELGREGLRVLRPAAVPLAAAGVFLAIVVLWCFLPDLRGEDDPLAASRS